MTEPDPEHRDCVIWNAEKQRFEHDESRCSGEAVPLSERRPPKPPRRGVIDRLFGPGP